MTSPSSRGRRAFLRAACAAAGAGVLLSRRDARADGEILEEARSQYNFIRVREFGSVRTMYFVAPDGTQYIESRVDRARPQSLDLDYTRTMMAGFLVRPDPRRLLMLGVGGGQMSNYLYARVPGLEIDAVDIDPEVIRLAQKYFDVPTGDPRYRCHADDARLFLERAAPGVTWDMIMLDAFRGVFVPYHLKTVEFYAACLKRLSPRGVVVANLHNVNRMYSYDRETLAAVFPNRYSFVSESGNQTTFVASAAQARVGAYEMRAAARAVQPRFDTDLLGLAARHYLRTDWETGVDVLRDDFKPVDLAAAAARHNETCIRGCRYGRGG